MPITASATGFKENIKYDAVKEPGKELQLLIQNPKGTTLGSLTLRRAESMDVTSIEFQVKGRRSLGSVLKVSGFEEEPIPLEKKRATRTFEKRKLNFTVAAANDAAYFFDEGTQRKFADLNIMLSST